MLTEGTFGNKASIDLRGQEETISKKSQQLQDEIQISKAVGFDRLCKYGMLFRYSQSSGSHGKELGQEVMDSECL